MAPINNPVIPILHYNLLAPLANERLEGSRWMGLQLPLQVPQNPYFRIPFPEHIPQLRDSDHPARRNGRPIHLQ
jgi:hypothetical protein